MVSERRKVSEPVDFTSKSRAMTHRGLRFGPATQSMADPAEKPNQHKQNSLALTHSHVLYAEYKLLFNFPRPELALARAG